MKVTSENPDEPLTFSPRRAELIAQVKAELLAARKRASGLSPAQIAASPTICALLGNGNPGIASVQLREGLHDIHDGNATPNNLMALEAACFSLGLFTTEPTHLARLEQFATKYYLDQRQARRYSDRGIDQLAQMIATVWLPRAAPRVELTILPDKTQHHVVLAIQLHRPAHTDMEPPQLSIWQGGAVTLKPEDFVWTTETGQDDNWQLSTLDQPNIIPLTGQTTIHLAWYGDNWPSFLVSVPALASHAIWVETKQRSCTIGIDAGSVSPV